MATQKGRNWSSGDIVTAANLSSIERGVSAVAEEYTPTTWANGDTVTAAALNNIEQGIANASGGGSSDFSTAEVTINDPNSCLDRQNLGVLWIDNVDDRIADGMSGGFSSVTFDTVLYKGTSYIYLSNINWFDVQTSGSVQFNDEYFTVTGDCVITFLDWIE